MATLVMGT